MTIAGKVFKSLRPYEIMLGALLPLASAAHGQGYNPRNPGHGVTPTPVAPRTPAPWSAIPSA